MHEHATHQSLSFGDALFLHLERDGMPLNVALLMIVDGVVAIEQCRDHIESKLPLIPRYRQRVVAPLFNIGLPSWAPDPAFDIANHVREVRLHRGTEAELRALVSGIISTSMDRNHPLWDFTVFSGLRGHRTAVLMRAHHCVADGISGVDIIQNLFDLSPDVLPTVKPRKAPVHAPPLDDPSARLLDGIVSSCFSAVDHVLSAQSELLALAHRFASNLKPPEEGAAEAVSPLAGRDLPSIDDLSRLLAELAEPADRLPFNVVCRGPQKFAWHHIPIDRMKQIKHECGATLNDVALALVAATVRHYCELHHVPVRGRRLRIVVPVSVRGRASASELGNRISFVPVTIPLDVRIPRKLIAEAHQRMNMLKNSHVAEVVGVAGSLLGTIPNAVQAMLGPLASQLPLSVCNLICTNIPGPKTPLYLLGHPIVGCYPYVPIGGEMGMNIALMTYNGAAYFGFSADAHAVPDLERMTRFLQQSFVEFRQAIAPRARRRRAPKAKPSRAPRKSVAPPAADTNLVPIAPAPAAPAKDRARTGPAPDKLKAMAVATGD